MLKTSYAQNKMAKIFVLQSISITTFTMLKKWKNRDAVCNKITITCYCMIRKGEIMKENFKVYSN